MLGIASFFVILMQTTFSTLTLTGSLADSQTIHLDQPLPLAMGRVELTLRHIPEHAQKETLEQFRLRIRAEQAAAGYKPPTADEVMRYLDEERNSWERD